MICCNHEVGIDGPLASDVYLWFLDLTVEQRGQAITEAYLARHPGEHAEAVTTRKELTPPQTKNEPGS